MSNITPLHCRRPPPDCNNLDNALFEISLMIRVALRAIDDLRGSDVEPEFFRLPAEDADMLHFSLGDLHQRVKELLAKVDASNLGMAAALPRAMA